MREDVTQLPPDAADEPDESSGALQAAHEELRIQDHELATARTALEVERQRYTELFDLAPVGYCVTDAHGIIIEANGPFSALLEEPQPSIVGKPLAAYVASEDRRRFRRALLELQRRRVELAWEVRLKKRGGQTLRAEVIVAPAASELGDLRWAVRDIEERMHLEEDRERLSRDLERRVRGRTAELERSRALLEAVLKQMPGGVLVVDTESANGLLLANRQAHEILGHAVRSRDQLFAETAARMRRLDGSSYTPDEVPLARSLRDGEVVERKIVAYGSPGEGERFLEMTAAPVRSPRGKVVAAVSVFTDVTARRRLEGAMREFVTNAAHELQTPIAAILSATEVLEGGAKMQARDRDRFLAHVREQATRLTRLSRALLVLARAQSGAEQPATERLVVRPLLQGVAASVATPASVTVRIDCPRSLSVEANRDLVEQALLNFVGNAARYTARGTITVAAERRDDGDVVIAVSDTGPGIAADRLELVFERFYRGDATSEGFGLGLAIAREAARALGGNVEVESEVDRGTTVRLVLPGSNAAS
jgi:PAS domain S-box-containing protein